MRIQKDIVTVVILRSHDDPLPRSLAEIAEFIDSGDGIGSYSLESSEQVPAEKVTDELRALANDGTSFDDVRWKS